MDSAVPGGPRGATQAAELRFWQTDGITQWPRLARRYREVFPLESINYATASIMDVGSGPLSVMEEFAPAGADVVPYDSLAEEYNRLVPDKKFVIRADLPQRRFSHIMILNVLDHMEDPSSLLEHVAPRLADDGQVWIFTHINRPYAPEEHPQDFRFWQLTSLVQRWFDLQRVWIHCDGVLFPYAWCGIVRPKTNQRVHRAVGPILANLACALTLAKYYAIRAVVKGLKLIGLRRLLPKPLQF